MTNRDILRQFRLTAQLLELHEENEFKIRTYSNAVTIIDNLTEELSSINQSKLTEIQGIGKGLAEKIVQMEETGSFKELNELKAKTPEGVIEMLNVKGLGPKKVRTLWKEYQIDDTQKLLKACEDNQLAKLKGFGEKTQESIKQALLFSESSTGKMLYADCEAVVNFLSQEFLKSGLTVKITGAFERKADIIDLLQFVVSAENIVNTNDLLDKISFLKKDMEGSSPFTWRGTWEGLPVEFLLEKPEKIVSVAFIHSAALPHLLHKNEHHPNLLAVAQSGTFESENAIYEKAGLPYIAPELREGLKEFEWANNGKIADLIELKDLKGIFHNHSTYSDGKHTLEQMATHCKSLGYQYLGISDHSKTASYANGLQEERIEQQHREIDQLNQKLAPFKVFKGIESDILGDGSLDYDKEVLKSFDFIVASVHANLNMDEEKATKRLIKAIENPYTTMLGHPTGRLLLRREGYPINHKKIIDACADNGVIIEINANPWRLDMDWLFIDYAISKGVILSINPDAHEMDGYDDMRYGVYVGRKGGLTKQMTFNALDLPEVEKYLTKRKK
jgi:DNA polymerase (family 10)